MDHPNAISPAAIALNRFGLGARAEEAPPAHPQAALLAEFDRYDARPAAWAGEPDAIALATRFAAARDAMTSDDASAKRATEQSIRRDGYDAYRSAVTARLNSALNTPAPFVERLVHFWANHFAVSVDKGQVAAYAGAFERDAIRPHVLGRFEDMLVAVEQHPAMQLFLDQARSVGPDSPAALRAEARNPAARRGLNENLAREIMELHTLGVRTGYTQADVTEFARALTGWSVAGGRGRQPDGAVPGAFVFRPALHEPGTRTVMSRTYAQPGDAQARAILSDLARSPATGRHIAFQLARHFVADNPPPALTERLARAFDASGGDLPAVYRALVDAPDAWSPVNRKFKTPWEWAVSSLRGLGWRDTGDLKAAPLLAQLGQPVWRPGSPAGYDDVAASWAAPDALVRRVEIAQRLAARTGDRLDARTLGNALLAGSLSAPTAAALSRAESATTSLALLLVSPDFQRR
ncbi:DUF1800 domain-containing protein [Burkholderia latens]|uniref:DUF1800 domain-containing protein n=1 Tax=Burkholderia latens TaxID=488446 RepID=UPI001AE55974|nr:DUF1800 domain-containing protein [Burkholderia latens]QTO46608.1 DUF1800 domain-containing protein [Burkholderia latens]